VCGVGQCLYFCTSKSSKSTLRIQPLAHVALMQRLVPEEDSGGYVCGVGQYLYFCTIVNPRCAHAAPGT
jgi:hypothetical protein